MIAIGKTERRQSKVVTNASIQLAQCHLLAFFKKKISLTLFNLHTNLSSWVAAHVQRRSWPASLDDLKSEHRG